MDVAKRVTNKVHIIGIVFVLLVALLAAIPVSANEGKLVHVVRFAEYEIGPVEDWLQGAAGTTRCAERIQQPTCAADLPN